MEREAAVLEGYLTKNEVQNRVYFSRKPSPGAKSVRTGYQVLEERAECSLLQVELFTGRTHQIRVQVQDVWFLEKFRQLPK